MPMVSATDTPYQGFPTGRTSPQAPSDYQQIPTSPGMFGSIEGEALEKAGQQGEKLATSVANIGAYQQHMADMTELDAMKTAKDDARHRDRYGDMTAGIDPATGKPRVPGWANMYGAEAVDYIKSGAPGKAFSDTIERIAATASNDRVRAMFIHQSRAERAGFDEAIGQHFNRQALVHDKDTRDAGNVVLLRDISNAWNNPAELNNKLNDLVALNLRGVTDPTMQQAIYYKSIAEGATKAIQAAEAAGDPDTAESIFNAYKSHMGGDEQHKAYAVFKHALDREAGTGAARGGTGGIRADVGARVADKLKARGWTDAAIIGALNNGIAESGLNEWGTPGKAGERGIFQFHPGSHLPKFTEAHRGKTDAESQAEYMANWVEQNMKGYSTLTDSQVATRRFHVEFENPADKSAAATAKRSSNTSVSEGIARAAGRPAAPPAAAAPAATPVPEISPPGVGTRGIVPTDAPAAGAVRRVPTSDAALQEAFAKARADGSFKGTIQDFAKEQAKSRRGPPTNLLPPGMVEPGNIGPPPT